MPRQSRKLLPDEVRICACRTCGKKFRPVDQKQRYCDTDCRLRERGLKLAEERAAKRETAEQKVRYCVTCGAAFTAKRSKIGQCEECKKSKYRAYYREKARREREERQEKIRQLMEEQRKQRAQREETRARVAEVRARPKRKAEPIRADFLGCTAGYALAEMAAIAKANRLSYGKLQGQISCNNNELPLNLIVPDFAELQANEKKSRFAKVKFAEFIMTKKI